ncbi:AraC family transcriptional regulator [Lachnospira eligens]|nr:AraC family transcriptional regulator [Lachnospira eligens]RHK53464.1 AraC family transcriptional regulator [Lachnospira eligens]RHK82840.1 AraC family transcriptional regulator [Lachnospira eligens]
MYHFINDNFHTDIATVPPSYKMKHFHEHNRWELMFIYSGSCTLYVGDEIYMLNTGGLALIPPYTAHMTTYLAGSDHSRYLLYFDTEELDFIAADSSLDIESIFHKHPVIHIPERRLDYITSVIQKISYEHNGVDSLSLSFVHSYFHELILFILRCQMYEDNVITKMDTGNELIQKVIEYIIENYHNDITMAATAGLFNMSESSLSKKFKAFTGFRFREYLINVRTHAAADLLVNTSSLLLRLLTNVVSPTVILWAAHLKKSWAKRPEATERTINYIFILERRLLWQILFYLMKISLIFLLVNFLMIRIIRQWVSIILSIILDIMVNGMTRYATTFITVRGLPGLFLNIMENILWSRCVSAMTSHTAHFLCSQAVTDSGAIIL